MHPTIRNLLTLANQPQPEDPGRPARIAARIQWSLERTAAWRKAQHAMDERCTMAVERLSEDAFDRLFEAEQAKVDAIRAEIETAAKADKWPKELYFSDDAPRPKPNDGAADASA